MNRKAFFTGAAVTVLVVLVVGIFTIGGPNQGRRERFDLHRFDDLRKISDALHCQNWRILQPTLPDELNLETIRAYCGGVEIQAEVLLDNETGTPYAYSRIDEKEYSVCAEFYDAEKTMRLSYKSYGSKFSFNPETGCVTGRVR